MSRHTSGEWAARNQLGVWEVVAPAAQMLIAEIPAGSIDAAGNAQLLAAAPALKAACLTVWPLLQEQMEHDDSGPPAAEVVAAYNQVRKALEQAGEDLSDGE
jgi:hypothetical protein